VIAGEFRALALALPETEEGAHHGHADFRVGGKVFASLGMPNADYGMVKLAPIEQEVAMGQAPLAFSPASGSWGLKGATRVFLPEATREQVEGTLCLAWRHAAPKRLVEPRDRLPR